MSTASRGGSRVRGWYALSGVLALAAGLGIAELVTGAMGRPDASPVGSVGDWFIEVTPTWLAEWAISAFGTADKLVLGIGMAVVLAVAGGGIGILTAWNRRAGMAAAAALVIVAAVIVGSRPETEGPDLVPIILGGVVAVPLLSWLVGRAVVAGTAVRSADDAVRTGSDVANPGVAGRPGGTGDPGTAGGGSPRRAFLQSIGGVAALAVAAGAVGRWMARGRGEVEESRDQLASSVDLPAADVPAGADLEIADAQPWRTPNDDFYRIDTAFQVPLVKAEDWKLRVHGLVEEEVELDYNALIDMGLVDAWVTLTCVSNEVGGDLVGNALWTGVPVADVLALARPLPEADAVRSTSQDGWNCGTPLEVLTDDRNALFAVGMNGEPLPVEHGFPVRMVVPGLYGYVSATKWVVELEVSRFDDFKAYWTTRGWSEQGPIKVSSRIEVPSNDASVAAGTVAVAGTAWAQHVGIEAVEVRVDGGEWQPARLADVPTADTWRQWVFEWDAEPGEYDLEVRATTADGEAQTGDEAPPAPDGSTGWHRISVEVT